MTIRIASLLLEAYLHACSRPFEREQFMLDGLTAFLYQRHRETIAFWAALDIWTSLNENFRCC
jgi:hypothetical protein